MSNEIIIYSNMKTSNSFKIKFSSLNKSLGKENGPVAKNMR